MTAITHLRLELIAEYLHPSMNPADFLGLLLSKTNLVTLTFPPAVDFDAHAVEVFLTRMGPGWSLPSLRTFARPVFLSSMQSRYWIDQTRSEVGSGLVDPTGPDRLADLVDPDQYQIDLVGTGH
jgi:hypothetical protein